jgi:tetratricopeptide (TPR) repeat protein
MNEEQIQKTKVNIDSEKLVKEYCLLGIKNFEEENYKEAISWYSKAIDLNPNAIDVDSIYAQDENEKLSIIYWRGMSYLDLEMYQEAINDFTKAIEINPKCSNPYYSRYEAHNGMGNFKKGQKDYDIFLKLCDGGKM